MLRLLLITTILVAPAQISFSASSGASSSSTPSSSSSSSSSSYSSPNNDSKGPQDTFLAANQLIGYGKFDAAHEVLKSLPDIGDRAERYNLLGFTARKSGNLLIASDFYEKALYINSRHVGALQYQGELFITLGKIEKAKQNLVRINKVCWIFSCDESKKLEEAIQKATNS